MAYNKLNKISSYINTYNNRLAFHSCSYFSSSFNGNKAPLTSFNKRRVLLAHLALNMVYRDNDDYIIEEDFLQEDYKKYVASDKTYYRLSFFNINFRNKLSSVSYRKTKISIL